MRRGRFKPPAKLKSAIASAALLAACAPSAAHPYSEQARADFAAVCPLDQEVCTCTWDAITRAMPEEDYSAALARFDVEGLMDPRITSARVTCQEKHPA